MKQVIMVEIDNDGLGEGGVDDDEPDGIGLGESR